MTRSVSPRTNGQRLCGCSTGIRLSIAWKGDLRETVTDASLTSGTHHNWFLIGGEILKDISQVNNIGDDNRDVVRCTALQCLVHQLSHAAGRVTLSQDELQSFVSDNTGKPVRTQQVAITDPRFTYG